MGRFLGHAAVDFDVGIARVITTDCEAGDCRHCRAAAGRQVEKTGVGGSSCLIETWGSMASDAMAGGLMWRVIQRAVLLISSEMVGPTYVRAQNKESRCYDI